MNPENQTLLVEALEYALAAHADQTRKGREAPYACHLMQVSGAILEHGGTVELAVAGLLHDAIEDCRHVDEAEIRARFGARVADIVAACSDTMPEDDPDEKSPWIERKIRYLDQIARADAGTHLVVACDKLDNLRSLVDDLHDEGPETLERFSASPEQTRWYYESVRDRVAANIPEKLRDAIDRALDELKRFISESTPDARA